MVPTAGQVRPPALPAPYHPPPLPPSSSAITLPAGIYSLEGSRLAGLGQEETGHSRRSQPESSEVELEDEFSEEDEKEEEIEKDNKPSQNDTTNAKRECDECGKMIHKKSIDRHKREVHTNPNVTCTSCGIKISMAKLAKHIQKVHQSERMDVQCNICMKEFNSSAILGNHMTRVHDNVSNPEKCKQCDKSFKTRPNLNRHMRQKHQ